MPVSLPNIMHTVEKDRDGNPDRRSRRPDSVVQSLQVDDAASGRVRHSVGATGCIKLVKK